MRGQARREAGEVALLVAILEQMPRLSEANCVGSPALFDPRGRWEEAEDADCRHAAALQLCRCCPVLAECRQWADGQQDLAHGVIGGRRPKPPGRPRRGVAA